METEGFLLTLKEKLGLEKGKDKYQQIPIQKGKETET